MRISALSKPRLKVLSTAEGVENEHQLSYLHSPGCQEVQGFLFSKPVTAEQLLLLSVH